MTVLTASANAKRAGSENRDGAPWTISATNASAATVRAPTPGVSRRSAKSRDPLCRGGERGVQPPQRHIRRTHLVMMRERQMRRRSLRRFEFREQIQRAAVALLLEHRERAFGSGVGEREAARRLRSARASARLTMIPHCGPRCPRAESQKSF